MTLRPRHLHLRELTAAAHDRLDRGVMNSGFFSSVPLYGLYLQRLHRLHRALETHFDGHAAMLVRQFGIEQRSGWLEADLNSLGLRSLPSGDAPALKVESITSNSGMFGCLYVMLGAALGARYLVRQAVQLDLSAGRGAAYLTHLAQSAHWPTFLQELERADIASLEDLGTGALATFDGFYDHLLEPIHL